MGWPCGLSKPRKNGRQCSMLFMPRQVYKAANCSISNAARQHVLISEYPTKGVVFTFLPSPLLQAVDVCPLDLNLGGSPPGPFAFRQSPGCRSSCSGVAVAATWPSFRQIARIWALQNSWSCCSHLAILLAREFGLSVPAFRIREPANLRIVLGIPAGSAGRVGPGSQTAIPGWSGTKQVG